MRRRFGEGLKQERNLEAKRGNIVGSIMTTFWEKKANRTRQNLPSGVKVSDDMLRDLGKGVGRGKIEIAKLLLAEVLER